MPRPERLEWSSFYWGAWLSDPNVRALTRDQRGGYIDVLAFSAQTNTPGRMLEDQVRRWAGYTPKQWPRHRDALAACFKIRGDTWIQSRMVREHRIGSSKREKRREAGRIGGIVSSSRKASYQASAQANGQQPSTHIQRQVQEQESESKALPQPFPLREPSRALRAVEKPPPRGET